MFDTERFIAEIQKRPCIWDVNNEEYGNKLRRQGAWVEIAEILYSDWFSSEENFKRKKVQILQKKWKGLRDYHNREKNKNFPSKNASGLRRKRKTPFLDMLQFLNVTKTNQKTCQKSRAPIEIDSEDSQPVLNLITGSTNMSCQETTPKSIDNRENDPDMNFLLSILSEMKSMTPSQNFDFRFEVMKVIKKIKYTKNDYDDVPQQSACNYQKPNMSIEGPIKCESD